jgi:hypothetical protein
LTALQAREKATSSQTGSNRTAVFMVKTITQRFLNVNESRSL